MPPSAADRIDEMPRLAATIPGFQLSAVSTVKIPAGPAMLTTSTAASSNGGAAGTDNIQRYEFWRDGTLLTISFLSPQGADNSEP
jgi:hypothetical protein